MSSRQRRHPAANPRVISEAAVQAAGATSNFYQARARLDVIGNYRQS